MRKLSKYYPRIAFEDNFKVIKFDSMLSKMAAIVETVHIFEEETESIQEIPIPVGHFKANSLNDMDFEKRVIRVFQLFNFEDKQRFSRLKLLLNLVF